MSTNRLPKRRFLQFIPLRRLIMTLDMDIQLRKTNKVIIIIIAININIITIVIIIITTLITGTVIINTSPTPGKIP